MKALKTLSLAAVIAAAFLASSGTQAEASYSGRSYYSSWSYYPQRSYYYRHYHYKPYATYSGYKYHYCIHYPTRPRYVYYYNPYQRTYWGRYDLEKGGYSLLPEDQRKENLNDIPEDAFPAPGEMPAIPESEDNVQIPKPAADDLPASKTPGDTPGE